jgi:hypothetical protein
MFTEKHALALERLFAMIWFSFIKYASNKILF